MFFRMDAQENTKHPPTIQKDYVRLTASGMASDLPSIKS